MRAFSNSNDLCSANRDDDGERGTAFLSTLRSTPHHSLFDLPCFCPFAYENLYTLWRDEKETLRGLRLLGHGGNFRHTHSVALWVGRMCRATWFGFG